MTTTMHALDGRPRRDTLAAIEAQRAKPFGGPYAGFASVFVERAGVGVVVPYLPTVLAQYGLANTALWLGVILSVQGFGTFFGQLVFGWISDSKGPRTALLISLTGTAVTMFLSAFCVAPWQLMVVRFFSGLANPATPALTYCLDMSLPQHKKIVVSHFIMALTGGWGAGRCCIFHTRFPCWRILTAIH